MSEKYNKQRTCVWLTSNTLNKIDALKTMDDSASSRGEIIEKAVDFYKSHIDLKQDVDYVAPILKSLVEGTMNTYFDRLNRNLFKESVELNILIHCFGKMFNIDEDTYKKLRKIAVDEVKQTKGTISLVDAQD